ncbi:PEP/pyruvate-binding domain-containing protein [Nocardia sp. NPDC058114]|uniref:PEP/pyruvate-binding domain-containing protein n=1 Tax=Nocardia sp. NPDC058114 TaxID=3346346 RepID=UPI0036DF5C91
MTVHRFWPEPDRTHGSKGYFLEFLRAAGYPVPAFRVLDRDGVAAVEDLRTRVTEFATAIATEAAGQQGIPADSVSFAVRSSGQRSMPGMMDTVLCVGLTETNLSALEARLGSTQAAFDALINATRDFCVLVGGVDPLLVHAASASSEDGPSQVASMRALFETSTGIVFPLDPAEQLAMAVEAVVASWGSVRARSYRDRHAIPDAAGPCVVIQAMIHGTAELTSGSGVVFSHDPLTGERRMTGEYVERSTGEGIVSGTVTPLDVSTLQAADVAVFAELEHLVERLHQNLTRMVEIEFVVERNVLWLVQVRPAVGDAQVTNAIAIDSWRSGMIETDEMFRRLSADALFSSTSARTYRGGGRLLGTGIPASNGVASGIVVVDMAEAAVCVGEDIVLLRETTEPRDFPAMVSSVALVTLTGGASSHAAVVARELGIPAVVGVTFNDLQWLESATGARVTVFGTTGEVWLGDIETEVAGTDDFPHAILDGAHTRTAIVGSLREIEARGAEILRTNDLALGISAGPEIVVATTDTELAEQRTAVGGRVAFLCSEGPPMQRWRAVLPAHPTEYVVPADEVQVPYIRVRLLVEAAHREDYL